MAEHRVTFKPRSCEITRGDRIVFRVKGNDSTLGELHVSVQGIKWMPKSKKKGIKMTWETFDTQMRKGPGWKVSR